MEINGTQETVSLKRLICDLLEVGYSGKKKGINMGPRKSVGLLALLVIVCMHLSSSCKEIETVIILGKNMPEPGLETE